MSLYCNKLPCHRHLAGNDAVPKSITEGSAGPSSMAVTDSENNRLVLRSVLSAASALVSLGDRTGNGKEGGEWGSEWKNSETAAKAHEIAEQPTDRKASNFPETLMQVLECEDLSDAITWHPEGRAFFIVNPEKFLNDVLPPYFKMTKIADFYRPLMKWGFQLATKGSESGAFFHKLFRRDSKELCKQMLFCNKQTSVTRIRRKENKTPKTPPASKPTIITARRPRRCAGLKVSFNENTKKPSLSTSEVLHAAIAALRRPPAKPCDAPAKPFEQVKKPGTTMYNISPFKNHSKKQFFSCLTTNSIYAPTSFPKVCLGTSELHAATKINLGRSARSYPAPNQSTLSTNDVIKAALDALERSGENVNTMRKNMLNPSYMQKNPISQKWAGGFDGGIMDKPHKMKRANAA